MKQRLPAKRTTGWTSNLLAAAGDVLVPLLFAFGVGSIFSLICGCNPFTLYSYIIKKAFFSVGGLLNTLGYTTPIIITGMATALSIRANMYNMGIEGQVFLGAFTAALAGYMIKGVPTALHVTLCLLIGAAFGAVYALIPGLLKAKLRVNEVVTTVMLNSIATQVTGFLTQSYLGTGDAYAHTEFIEQTARLAKLNSKYRCTTAIFIALAIWLILYFILKKTKFGYEISRNSGPRIRPCRHTGCEGVGAFCAVEHLPVPAIKGKRRLRRSVETVKLKNRNNGEAALNRERCLAFYQKLCSDLRPEGTVFLRRAIPHHSNEVELFEKLRLL